MIRRFILPVATLVLATANASACRFPASSLDQQVNKAEEIFIATLLEAKVLPKNKPHEWPRIEGRFEMKKVLKGGEQPREIVLTTGFGRSDCGVVMMVSRKYIIFKGRRDSGIGDETGTQSLEDFQEDEMATKIQSIVRQQQIRQRK